MPVPGCLFCLFGCPCWISFYKLCKVSQQKQEMESVLKLTGIQHASEHPTLCKRHRNAILVVVLQKDLCAASPRGGCCAAAIVITPVTHQHPVIILRVDLYKYIMSSDLKHHIIIEGWLIQIIDHLHYYVPFHIIWQKQKQHSVCRRGRVHSNVHCAVKWWPYCICVCQL